MSRKNNLITIAHGIRRTSIIAVCLAIIIFLINVAPNYVKEATQDGIRLIINNNNVTTHLRKEIIVQDNNPFISVNDVSNFKNCNLKYLIYYQNL